MTINSTSLLLARRSVPGISGVNKFGYAPDIDTVEVAVWDQVASAVYPWPTSGDDLTLVSTDGADDSAGTGMRTAEVTYQDTNNIEYVKTFTIDGTTPVSILSTTGYRCYRIEGKTYGSGGTNAGTIQVKHATTVIAQVTIGEGQSLMALYTVPASATETLVGLLSKLYLSAGRAEEHIMRLRVKEPGNGFNTKFKKIVNASDHILEYDIPQQYPAGTDMMVTSQLSSGANGVCSAEFDICVVNEDIAKRLIH